jgi:hypothetical protein
VFAVAPVFAVVPVFAVALVLVDAEPELDPAADNHFSEVYAIGVFESRQFVDIVLYTVFKSPASLEPKHFAAESINPPPLLQTQPLNFGTVE